MLCEFVDVCTEGSKPPDVKESTPNTLRRRPTLNLAFQFMGNNRALAGQWVPQRIFRRALRLEVKLIRKFRKFRLLKQTLTALRDTTREDRQQNGELHKKAKNSARGEVVVTSSAQDPQRRKHRREHRTLRQVRSKALHQQSHLARQV